MLYDAEGRHLCSHSLFARQFRPTLLTHLFEGNDRKDINHTLRIEQLIQEVYAVRGMSVPVLSPLQVLQCRWDEVVRWSIKVPQRIANWPNKLRKKWQA